MIERFGSSYRPIFLSIAIATAGVLPAFLTGGLAVQIRDELDFSAGALGLAVASFFASASLSAAFFGRMVERVGSHNGMRVAAVFSAATLLGIAALAHSWRGLVLCLVFGGFANSLSHPATNLSLARQVPPERQGFSFGAKQAAIPTATLLAGLAVPTIGLTVGWRWAFVGAAALVLALALCVPRETTGEFRYAGTARKEVARTWSLVFLALGIGLGSTAATPLGAFIVESSVEAGMKVGPAGLLLALGSVSSIAVRIAFGHLADRMSGGRLRLVAGMLMMGALGFVLLAAGTQTLMVAGSVFAFAAGWGWPGLFNFAIVKTSPGAPAAATGITQTGASAGAAAGPLVFGLVVDASSYGVAWLVCGLVALAAAAAILAGRRMLLRDRGSLPEQVVR